MAKDSYVLGCDVGGTKVNLAVYSRAAGLFAPLVEQTYASAAHQDLEAIIADFLAGCGYAVKRAGIAVAGPVINNRAKLTKLPWLVEAAKLQNRFAFSEVVLLNDLVATSYGILELPAEQLFSLAEGQIRAGEAKAVLAPGTGLGEAFLLWNGLSYQAYPSEGGHVLFSPVDGEQIELLQHLLKTRRYVSFDLLCSGEGLPLIYGFLKSKQPAMVLPEIEAEIADALDPAAVISAAALSEPSCSLCTAALDLYVRVLAAEAGNLALKVLATGGIFLGGGISPKILPALKYGFMGNFIGHGPMRDLLAAIPVTVVLNQQTALIGAASRLLGHK